MSVGEGARVLFVSYDGVTDPLGQSQIVPYLKGLVAHGYEVHLLSFEKPERYATGRDQARADLATQGIRWWPLPYTKRPPVASTVFDALRMRRAAARLHREHGFALVHCRSYIAALTGLFLKRRYGVRFLFDMRGFWADEKVEDGSWRQENLVLRTVYRFFKRREAEFLRAADGVVSLTDAGRRELERWPSYRASRPPVRVIPCSADFELFRIPAPATRAAARRELGIPEDAFVVAYLGSLGGWYLLDEMLDFFATVAARRPGSRLLVVTPSPAATVLERARARGVEPAAIVVTSATRAEVPQRLAAADIGLSFIRASYAKQSSSPTKIGEYLAMGLPVVANAGVGDTDTILARTGGIVLKECGREEYERAVDALPRHLAADPRRLRARAREIFDLERAVSEYAGLYAQILSATSARHRASSGHPR